MSDESPTFIDLLDALFDHVPGSLGRPLSAAEVCERSSRGAGPGISASYLSQLRHRRSATPSFNCIVSLATAFDVDLRFFTLDFHSRHRDLSWDQRIRLARIDRGMLDTAAAIYALTPVRRTLILALLDTLEAKAMPPGRIARPRARPVPQKRPGAGLGRRMSDSTTVEGAFPGAVEIKVQL